MSSSESGEDSEQLAILEGSLNKTLSELYELSDELRPQELMKKGLFIAVESLINRLSGENDVKISLTQLNYSHRFDISVELPVYQMIREALINIVYHSDATEASVRLRQANQWLRITIQDNGNGFDPYATIMNSDENSSGLANMELQADVLGGSFDLFSSNGVGTIIKISIPTTEQR